jgi:hypothetical protein
VAIDQECPNGSVSLPQRSPQNMSVTGISTLAPEATAWLKAKSTSLTYRKMLTVEPPSDLGKRAEPATAKPRDLT